MNECLSGQWIGQLVWGTSQNQTVREIVGIMDAPKLLEDNPYHLKSGSPNLFFSEVW